MAADSSFVVQLIQRAAAQDREAFSQLYDRFSSLVFSLAMRILRSQSDAEDLLQEVFMQLWRQASGYSEERGSPEAWIINIARSRAIDKLRSIRRRDRSFLLTDYPGGAESPENVENAAGETEARLAMTSALRHLTEAQRKVMELAYYDGLSQSEIAEHLKEPLGTVKTRIRAGIQRLRDILKNRVA
jgi:RNA polymerase sigma-70 factor, ECF subfamily